MYKYYLKYAARNTFNLKNYSLLNVAGLAVGIACCLIIFLWVHKELSYDDFHTNKANIYRCYRQINWNGVLKNSSVTSSPVGPTLTATTLGIESFVRMAGLYKNLKYETKSFYGRGQFVDSNFFDFFSFAVIDGNSSEMLTSPNSIVLTRSAATRLFPDQNPIGKIIHKDLIVTGIVDDVPANSSIEFDFLVSIENPELDIHSDEEWWGFSFNTYFMLQNNADVNAIGSQIRDLFKTVDEETELKLFLQPLTEMHLHDINGGGRIVYVYTFSLVAILLILVVCINFMNLATAGAIKKAKEIGLRKAIGAGRGQLIIQILSETVFQTIMAVIIAIGLIELILPHISGFFGSDLTLNYDGALFIGLGILILITSLASGLYPSLVISSFKPSTTLGKSKSGGGGNGRGMGLLRKSLIIFQFAISTGLIFTAFVVYSQLEMIDNMDIGIDYDNVVCVRAEGFEKDIDVFKYELLQSPDIIGVTGVYEPPAWCGYYMNGFEYEGKPEDRDARAGFAFIDYDYIDFYGIKIVEGRNFSKEMPGDETAYIINESAARAMQMDNPVGMSIGENENKGPIIGVVKDFHFSSLHDEIEPLIMTIYKEFTQFLCVKLSPANIPAGLNYLRQTWDRVRPNDDYRYRFLDDYLSSAYKTEQRTGSIVLAFSIITVIVASLGLFGLMAFSTERRTKEIGIRKVLGSSVFGIIRLVSKEFLILVSIGSLLSFPIAYYFASRWLESFAYRINLGWLVFVESGLIAAIIAIATVYYHAVKAARSNPINAIKVE
ncbi:MAG: ABC transporter permease [Candidatus Zixiibacteriota bacterium]